MSSKRYLLSDIENRAWHSDAHLQSQLLGRLRWEAVLSQEFVASLGDMEKVPSLNNMAFEQHLGSVLRQVWHHGGARVMSQPQASRVLSKALCTFV